jgi:pimeloyl-ACP methyl ester carboxylesterase
MQLRYISNPHLIAEAGGDPWAINENLQAGRPAQISDLAQAFHDAGRCTAESSTAFDEARRRFEAAWNRVTGEQSINEFAEVQRVTIALGAQSLQLPNIGVDLEHVAAALAEAQRTGAALVATLESQLQQIDNQLGQALDLEADTQLTAAERSALDALIRAMEQQAIDDTECALNQLHSVRSGYSNCLQRSLTTLRTDGYDPTVLRAVDAADSATNAEEPMQILPPGMTAEEINRWWKTLGPQQQSRLIADHKPELGNLNGVPVVVRSRVNQAVMNDDLRRVEDAARQFGVSVNHVLGDPGRYGLTAVAITRYNNARRTREGLNTLDGADDRDVILLKYQPEAFGGKGSAAVAMGNPDTAANTAVLVTGAGTSLQAGTLAKTEAVRLYQESARAGWGRQTAVVLWVGYDAPNNWYDPDLREPNMARAGARALAADVNALAITHEGAPRHMTVVGHSYGSTVVSDAAAAHGMHTNDVVLLGSPGTDLAHSAADFHFSPGGHLYIGAASGDAVTWSPGQVTGPGLIGVSVGGLGDDPSVDGYGSTRFKAEAPGHYTNPVYDHLHYFDDGSESLFSIADVASGHGDALQHDGMTARHRGEYGLGGWFDPEAARTATTGHRHRTPRG